MYGRPLLSCHRLLRLATSHTTPPHVQRECFVTPDDPFSTEGEVEIWVSDLLLSQAFESTGGDGKGGGQDSQFLSSERKKDADGSGDTLRREAEAG